MTRLDVELVRRGEMTSRTRAAKAIAAGVVTVDGRPVTKAAFDVPAGAVIEVSGVDRYVSRAAHKLIGALAAFGIARLDGRTSIDVGSSTGGFTQVLLERGAEHVTGLDVGHDQLDPGLRADPRVEQHDGVNVREVPAGIEPATMVVADVSFISLTYVMATLAALSRPGADLCVLVKPQFEVGRADLGAGGVVRDPALHARAIRSVMAAAHEAGLEVLDVCASPLPGNDGNREFFLHLACPPPERTPGGSVRLDAKVDTVVAVTSEQA